MLSYFWRCYSAAKATLRYFGHLGYHTLGLLSRIFPLGLFSRIFPVFVGDSPSKLEKRNDPEADVPVDIASKNADCDTYTVRLQPQYDLEIVGVGGSGQVYKVGDQVVLKTCRIFERPGNSASDNDRYYYASDTLFHNNLLQNERTVLQLLQQQPHPHIIEAVDTDQPEGIYLRKYKPLARTTPAQPQRIQWYRDITDALCHIHRLGIAHADVRIDNILFDEQGCPILCDFSAASPFGQPNFVIPDLPLPINGPSPTLSEATDMFAMASLIFQVEQGAKPELSVNNDGTLVLPELQTGCQGINMVIRNAWLGNYAHTWEMLEHLSSIDSNHDRGAHGIQI